MYIKNGIAYAGEETPLLKVYSVRVVNDHTLWLQFSTGETKLFDCSALLSKPAFAPLADQAVFRNVAIDHGVPVWNDGTIDIDPELLYEQGVPAEAASA